MPRLSRIFLATKYLFLLFLLVVIFPSNINAAQQFIENFDDGNYNGWVVVNDPDRTACSAPWMVSNGALGIAISQPYCTTNIMPNDTLWNNLGNNYIFELDMRFVEGTDHNVAFRFTPSSPSNNWYGLHFQSPGDVIIERLNPGVYATSVAGSYPNNRTYRIKIVVNGNQIKTFIDDVLVRDYTSTIDRFPTGRIALRAGTGGDSVSETYFDNIMVTSLEPEPETLPIPYESQIDERWADEQYDSLDATIGQVGCALTSAEMVLQYYGIDQLPDGTVLNTSSLNQWLNANGDGYWRRGLTSWNALTRLSRLVHAIDPESPILDYRKIKPPDFGVIDQIIQDEDRPVIFEETKPNGAHFVTANGVTTPAAEYSILDPLDQDRTSFNMPPDQLVSARYLFPTNTNLSALVLHTDKNLHTSATDPNNTDVSSQFSVQQAIGHDDGDGNTGEEFNELNLEDPMEGQYGLEFTADTPGWYSFELYAYDQGANAETFKETIYIGNSPVIFNLNYAQTGDSFADLDKQVTYGGLRADVRGLVAPSWLRDILLKVIGWIERYYPMNPILGGKYIGLFEKYVTRYSPRYISVETKEFLLEEVGRLRVWLAGG